MNNNKRKTRLYLDTSVISMIDAPVAPDKEAITKEFFRQVVERQDEFELLLSPIVDGELQNAPPDKRALVAALLESIPHTLLPERKEAVELANRYVDGNVLGRRHIKDLTHIAYAVISRCDYIISWNMKHFVRIQTISRVNAVNFENHYPTIMIVTPEFITGELP